MLRLPNLRAQATLALSYAAKARCRMLKSGRDPYWGHHEMPDALLAISEARESRLEDPRSFRLP